MRLTMQIILDRLSSYGVQHRPGGEKDFWVDQVRLLTSELPKFSPNVLYVCTAGQLRKAKTEGAEQAAFVCLGSAGNLGERSTLRGANLFLIQQEHIGVAEVLNDLLEMQAVFTTWERRLNEAVLTQQDFQTLIDLSCPVFQNNFCMLWDPSYNVLAYTQWTKAPSSRLEQVVEQGYFSKEMTDDLARMGYIKNALTFVLPTLVPTPNYMGHPFILKTFVAAHRVRYIASFYFTDNRPSQGQLDIFKMFCERLDTYITRMAESRPNSVGSRTDQCMADLIEKADRGEEYLRDRATVLGLKEDNVYRLALITFQEYSQEQALYLRMRIRGICGKVIASIYRESLVLLFNLGGSSLLEQEAWAERYQKIFELLPVCNARASFSSSFSLCQDVSTAYRQAQVALEYGRKLRPEERAYHYKQYYIYDMIDCYSQRFPLEKMYVQKLALLVDAKNYANSNLHLLRTYLANERNISQTAKALYMHRNSVIYRIDRIREQLVMDLDEPDVRLRLLISFKILELLTPDVFLRESDDPDEAIPIFGE